MNPIPTSPLEDDITTAPLGPVRIENITTTTLWEVGGGGERTIYMPICIEGSGMPTMRPKTAVETYMSCHQVKG